MRFDWGGAVDGDGVSKRHQGVVCHCAAVLILAVPVTTADDEIGPIHPHSVAGKAMVHK